MSPENHTPQSERSMYMIPTTTSETLQAAMDQKQAFADEIRAAHDTSKLIEVTDVPGYVERVEAHDVASAETRVALGGGAIEATRRASIENPTPQQMANALGSPYKRDEIGRIVPKQPEL